MNQLTEGRKPQTKRARFTSLLAFFNFVKNNLGPDFINPCDSPMLRKLFRTKVKTQFDILEKETVDEIIFRTDKSHNLAQHIVQFLGPSPFEKRFTLSYFENGTNLDNRVQ